MPATVFELNSTGIISFTGEDAVSFLHAQLTSDLAALEPRQTQYSGYCSPKGRLFATFLLWRREGEILLLLPESMRAAVQERLTRYVLRARVKVANARSSYALFGVAGDAASATLASLSERLPRAVHEVVCANGVEITRLPVDRYLLLCPSGHADAVRAGLSGAAALQDEKDWAGLDIAAGIPVITPVSQEQYVPQMVNLDLIGALSYTKGCYPGQEIVARMHYLGRLKQRMYRVRVTDAQTVSAGDPLYSDDFGPAQASGTLLYAARATRGSVEALAVIQKVSADTTPLHLQSINGPTVELIPLPYAVPA